MNIFNGNREYRISEGKPLKRVQGDSCVQGNKYPRPLRESGFADGRSETSPDSEQIERAARMCNERNSVSVEQIQDRGRVRGQNHQHPSQPTLVREGAPYPLYFWEKLVRTAERSDARETVCVGEAVSWVEFLGERSEHRNSGEGLKSSPHPNLSHPGKELFPRPTGEGRVRGQAAFTLAEVLITLGVIGVVAAMTIPGLITKYKVHQLKSQFLKSYSTVQQAFKQMEADDVSINPKDYPGQTFYKIYQNYFQVAVQCGVFWSKNAPCMNLSKNSYKTLDGNTNISNYYFDDGQFVLQDGTVIFIENPSVSSSKYYVWVHVDLNGVQKPNKWGYDLFTFEMLDGELRTMGDLQTKYNNLEKYCNVKSTDPFNGIACAQKAKTDTDYFKKIIKEFK